MRLTGWRYTAFIGIFIGSIGLYSYVTMISPMLNPEPYKMFREEIAQKSSQQKK